MAYQIHPERSPDKKPDVKLEVLQRIIHPITEVRQYVLGMSLPCVGGRFTQKFVAEFDIKGELTFEPVECLYDENYSEFDSICANNVFDDLYGDYQEVVVAFISDIYSKGH